MRVVTTVRYSIASVVQPEERLVRGCGTAVVMPAWQGHTRRRWFPNLDTCFSFHFVLLVVAAPRYRHGRRRVIQCGCGTFDSSGRNSILSPPRG